MLCGCWYEACTYDLSLRGAVGNDARVISREVALAWQAMQMLS